MLKQKNILKEYEVELRFIQGIKNEEVGTLNRKDFVHEQKQIFQHQFSNL